ncbi:MAG: mandelate racemase/muconate lactonizing enzyme family protein [Gammaproteobacteria bacterium]
MELPLHTPYKVAGKVFRHFQPLIAQLRDDDGREGIGEAIISEGYSHESFADGWRFLRDVSPGLVGLDAAAARSHVEESGLADYPTAATTLLAALDHLSANPLLDIAERIRVPLLDPVHGHELDALPDELEALLARGFRTLKVKVGFDVDADLKRVERIQSVLAGRAEIRLDANRGFTREQGCRFAAALEPAGMQLFEQPCAADDWGANAAVAQVSAVPVMMDESIYGLEDIDRAAAMDGVGFVKLKLKKLGDMARLKHGLEHIRSRGLIPVMGDGVATDICCWQEACVARVTLDNAGEMNGFLKLVTPLFENPLVFDAGDIVLEPGYSPRLDATLLERVSSATERFSASR